jgi:hypothetical protein
MIVMTDITRSTIIEGTQETIFNLAVHTIVVYTNLEYSTWTSVLVLIASVLTTLSEILAEVETRKAGVAKVRIMNITKEAFINLASHTFAIVRNVHWIARTGSFIFKAAVLTTF